MAEQPSKRPAKPAAKALADNAPWKPPKWEVEEAGAVQALMRGQAEPHQQKMALQFIVEKLAGTYEMHFYGGEDGERNTSFALGRAFVGQQLVKLTKINLAVLTKRRTEQG